MSANVQLPRTYQATLRVAATGYWFTAGGQKGSFGYVPHLRDDRNMPVYPDTQVVGNFKMAARWLAAMTQDPEHRRLCDCLFGRGGDDAQSSLLKAGDLLLDDDSRKSWRPERFEVKTRIRINDDSRTVDRHFLVDLELALLDGCVLEAPLYLVLPPKEQQNAPKFAAFLCDAIRLLSGFGAFRSRGYGRGEITLTDLCEIRTDNPKRPPNGENGKRCHYALTALTHMRSKPVDPGHAQVVPTWEALFPGQIKGWLARAYHETYGNWPSPAQMAGIVFSGLFPSPSPGILAWPAPMTTLTDQKITWDSWGKNREEEEDERQENFFSGKVKPLRGHTVVADEGNGKFWPYKSKTRMRNAVDESFVTGDNSLYAQEFLPAGTVFSGSVEFVAPAADEKFVQEICALLANTTPAINGALFKPTFGAPCPQYGMTGNRPELLGDVRPFSQDMRQGDNRMTITTLRSYNTMCRRPRRGRIVVAPGSILQEGGKMGDAAWPGFGEKLARYSAEETKTVPQPAAHAPAAEAPGSQTDQTVSQASGSRNPIRLTDAQKKLTSAQAGQLRLLLHPALTPETIRKMLNHRIKKYEEKAQENVICSLLKALLETLPARGENLSAFRNEVQDVIKQLALARWQKKQEERTQKARSHKLNAEEGA